LTFGEKPVFSSDRVVMENLSNTGVQLLEVSSHSEEQRLDNFLLSRLKGLPKSHLYRLIRKGEIRVNKKRCKPDQRLFEGDVVRVAPLRLAQPGAPLPPGEGLIQRLQSAVIYEDEYLMVLNKPVGLPVHGGSGVVSGLIEALRYMAGEGGYRELVHRLDRETSGCLLVAKTGKVLKKLQAALKAGEFTKRYLALVHGQWPENLTRIDAPLLKFHPHDGESFSRVDPEGKPAKTLFNVRSRLAQATLVEATLVTGRTHQIRVHTQHAGHPIVGDSRYTWDHEHAYKDVRSLCLHAEYLAFKHPETGQQLELTAELPPNLSRLLV